jgi:diaminopimelate epimerase
MELRFVKWDPSGNTTILILDPVPRDRHADVAVELMKDRSLCGEQVGYLEAPSHPAAVARLQMMGGEFCGNASRCLAAQFVRAKEKDGSGATFLDHPQRMAIEVSGHEGVLEATVTALEPPRRWNVEIEMPLPLEIRTGIDDKLGLYSIVVFEGIVHIVLWEKSASELLVQLSIAFLKASNFAGDTWGILFYDETQHFMVPVVSVEAVNTLIYEQSCGSGTVAVGAALAEKRKVPIDRLTVKQPGGELLVNVVWDEGIRSIHLSGEIHLVAEGTVYLEDGEVTL